MVNDRTPYKPRCRLPADQRHAVPELHDYTTDMQAGSAGSGVGIVIWLISKSFEVSQVSQVSFANQKRALSKAA